MFTNYHIWVGAILLSIFFLPRVSLPAGVNQVVYPLLLMGLIAPGLSSLGRSFARSKYYALSDPIYRMVLGLERFFNLIPWNPYALGLPHHLLDLGNFQLEQKKYDKAESTYQEALQVAEKQYSPDSLLSAMALSELNRCLSMQGKYTESEKVSQRLISVLEKLGTKSGSLRLILDPAMGMIDLCSSLARQGRYAEAEAIGKRAVAMLESNAVSGDPKIQLRNLATALNNLGVVYDESGKFPEALASYQRSLGLKQKIHPEFDKSVAIAYCNVGFAATNNNDLQLATKHLEEARRILAQLKITDDNLWATVLNNIGDVQRLQGNLDAAEATLLESFKWREKNLPPTNSSYAEGLLSLARLYEAKNDMEQGDSYFKRAITNLEARKPINKKKLSEGLSEYAKFLNKAGKHSQASDVEARAASLIVPEEGCLPVT